MDANIGWIRPQVWVFAIVLGVFSKPSLAAIDRSQALNTKKHTYIENGRITGGEAGTAFTLLEIRRILAPKDKIERILLDLGDAEGKPLRERVSYFQVSLEKGLNRVVIDLPQMLASGVSPASIRQAFAGSEMVKEAKINFDPVDTTITIQLQLKKAAQVEVFKLPSTDKPSRIAIDLKEKV